MVVASSTAGPLIAALNYYIRCMEKANFVTAEICYLLKN